MKTKTLFTLMTIGALAALFSTLAQQLPPAPPVATNPPPPTAATDTNAPAPPLVPSPVEMDTNARPLVAATTNEMPAEPSAPLPPPVPETVAAAPTNVVVEPALPPLKEGELRLNFRNAPIGLVLNYMSEAAGFIIELRTSVQGTVDVYSAQPVTKEEAVDLLNSMLNKNGYAAIRNGRKLTIVSKAEAIRGNIPVKTGNNPANIPNNDEIVTQIIPIRFVEAPQLAKDLAPLISPQATIVANEAGNSLALTDTQANIRHMVEIIHAIDMSAEEETQLRVFPLEHADPNEMANLLISLFPEQGASGGSSPSRFDPRRSSSSSSRISSFLAAMAGGPPGGPSGAGQQQRARKRMQVVAVPDARTSSLVVTTTKDLMEQIADMIQQLDHPSPKETSVQVFHLENADPQEVVNVLQDMFQSSTSSRGSSRSSSRTSALGNRVQQSQSSGSRSRSGSSSSRGTSRSSSF
jgi:general secretion pathway protein D